MKKSVSLEEINRLSNEDCDLILAEDETDQINSSINKRNL